MNTNFQGATNKGKDEWLTPPSIIKDLGPFDMDPCSAINQPFKTAEKQLTKNDNGLIKKWEGRIWCNPPYGDAVTRWLDKCAKHANCIALIYARTETRWFQKICFKSDAILFIQSRIRFFHISGKRAKDNAGCGSCLVAWGDNNVKSLQKSTIMGTFIPLQKIRC